MALLAGSTWVAAAPLPSTTAQSDMPVAAAIASATGLLKLPMARTPAAGTPPLPELPRRLRLPPVVRGDGGRRLGSVSWLADHCRQRPPSREMDLPVARWPPAPRSQLRDSAGLTPASRHPERYSDVAVEYAPGAAGFVKGAVGTLEPMPEPGPHAVAIISVHASPLSDLGSGENGGMNLAIRRLCEGLSLRGVPTDVFVRRDGPGPDEQLIAPLSRLVRLPVGPARVLPQGRRPVAPRRFQQGDRSPCRVGASPVPGRPRPLLVWRACRARPS